MSHVCHVCGSPEIDPAASDHGSARCAACAPARDHVVSMQTGPDGSSLAVCPCGWSSEIAGPGRYRAQEAKVKQHWRDVIRWAHRNPLAFMAICVALPTIAGNVLVACGWSL